MSQTQQGTASLITDLMWTCRLQSVEPSIRTLQDLVRLTAAAETQHRKAIAGSLHELIDDDNLWQLTFLYGGMFYMRQMTEETAIIMWRYDDWLLYSA